MRLFQFFIISLLVLTGCNGNTNSRIGNFSGKIITPDSLMLIQIDNSAVNLQQYNGKVIFINFWATWCKPCIKEMPSIQRTMEIFKNENIAFLFASDEDAEQIEEFKKENEYMFNYLRVESFAELNIPALPTTFIFNAAGQLVFSESGYRQWDSKENIDLISELIKAK